MIKLAFASFFYALIWLYLYKKSMFSQGQIVFALLFVIVFVIIMIIMYRKDLKMHKTYYKGSLWVLLTFLLFIALLFVIKVILKD